MEFIELESERLLYRRFAREDFPIVFDWLGNAEDMRYRLGDPRTETEAWGYMDWAMSSAETEDIRNFEYAVVLKENGALIGSASLFDLANVPDLGWMIHRDYQRQGYGTECGRTMLRLGFDILGFRRIVAGCDAENYGSYRIMERIGMRREAYLIKARQGNCVLDYEWRDAVRYAVLKEEYRVDIARRIYRADKH